MLRALSRPAAGTNWRTDGWRGSEFRAANIGAPVQTLSGGNQQRVVLAKWLATDPKVLILDSPTVGVDIRNKQGIYGVVRQLAEAGVAILLISDEVPEVYFNCDRVLHMRGGRISGEFTPANCERAMLSRRPFMPRPLGAIFGRTETALIAANVVTAAILSLSSPYFLTLPNVVNLVEAYSVTTILAAGVFVVLVSGGIDISFTATAAATQYLAAYLATSYGFPLLPTLALAAALGIAMGSINALLTYYLRVVSIIVTIATSSIYYALLIYFTDAEEIYNLPDWWSNRFAFFRYVTVI